MKIGTSFVPDIWFELVEQVSRQLLIWRSGIVPYYLERKNIKSIKWSPLLVAFNKRYFSNNSNLAKTKPVRTESNY